METSPYGLTSLWLQGDLVTRAVALLLLAMSIASWYVMIAKGLQALRFRRALDGARRQFWTASSLETGIASLGDDNPFSHLAKSGARAMQHHDAHAGQLGEQLTASDWLTMSLRQAIDESAARLSSGMAVLASVGSTAPFVGLFGTVWGIYHALVGIGASGNVGIDAVAGPIGETLIMTALGLAVAIPAVLGYNALVRGNKFIIARMNRFAHDLHAYFVTGARISHNGGQHGL